MNNLPQPTVIETIDYDVIVADIKKYITASKPDLQIVESDDYATMIEAFAYRELHLRAKLNYAITQMLPHLSTGANLDNFIAAFYGNITRLEGESDTDFYNRAKNSLYSHSTAGARGSYIFHTKSFSRYITDVNVISPSPGVIKIYYKEQDKKQNDDPYKITVADLQEALSSDKVRPLTDKVEVYRATPHEVTVHIMVYARDIFAEPDISDIWGNTDTDTTTNSAEYYKIGRDINISNLYHWVHDAQSTPLYKVSATPDNSIICQPHEYLILKPTFEVVYV